jgi:hypothetical protein
MCNARTRERKQADSFARGFENFGGVKVADTLLFFK